MRDLVLFEGARVMTTDGNVAIVAFMLDNQIYVYGRNGLPQPATIVGDAFGGEHDQSMGLLAN